MEIIVSHNHLDFDGLAAMVAAKHLYPRAELVFVGGLSGNVQRFMSLHKDSLIVHKIKEIPLGQIELVVVVDTNSPSRLGDFAKWVRETSAVIHVYDHHPEALEPLNAAKTIVDQVGAVTTLMVELLQAREIKISSFEATVMALGIYEDTGSLTYNSTTARDARAVAYLLECGANLGIVANFIELTLTDEQKQLFDILLASVVHKSIAGVNFVFATAAYPKTLGNLDFLTQKLGDLESYDAFFTLVEMGKRVYIVARSRTDSVDMREICAVFGGGGHAMAASATVKGRSLASVLEELEWVVKEKTSPPIKARDIMSSPVKTVPMHLTLEEAGRIMLRYGHTGLPVLENEQLVGVISRRDVDKGKIHGLGHSPVKGYMSRNPITIGPDTPLSELQYILVKHDIGRLPVMEEGKLLGIVSRTDVLRTFHGKDYPEGHKLLFENPENHQEIPDGYWFSQNLREKMLNELPQPIILLLKQAGALADQLGVRVYVIGGFVRDLCLGVPNLDVDLVVEGSGPDFARILAQSLEVEVRVHERFGTAMILLSEHYHIDVATARIEYYEYPAALPTVEKASLRHDLYRRDFTINAMAIQINAEKFGDLVDFFGGRLDLKKGFVRVLYNLSFVEDPTRIIRAVRFEQRLGFTIEPQTLRQINEAVYRGFLRDLSAVRIRDEMISILNEENRLLMLQRIVHLNIEKQILPEVDFGPQTWKMLERVPETWTQVKDLLPDSHLPDTPNWMVYWLVLFHQVEANKASVIAAKYQLTKKETNLLISAYQAEERLIKLGLRKGKTRISALYTVLNTCGIEVFCYLLTLKVSKSWQNQLTAFLAIMDQAQIAVTGHDLIQMGLKPGPQFKEILDVVQAARLDGIVSNKEQEIALIHQILAGKEEESK